jgi:hypothetical protein
MSFKDGRFGLLTVEKQLTPDTFECSCACGNGLIVWRSLLANRVQLDCGMCRRRRRDGRFSRNSVHGHVRAYKNRDGGYSRRTTGEYNSWDSMIYRCSREWHHGWDDYGGRGIRVCKRWREPSGYGFFNFIRDMGPRPIGTTLDRINPQGHYEPGNCRWATPQVQTENQRRFLWKDFAPPPVEKIREMELRVRQDFDGMVCQSWSFSNGSNVYDIATLPYR